MNIGEKIKNLRMQQGLTQEELAGRSELSKGFISQLENDLTSPSISTLKDILLVLGTDLPDFFSDLSQAKLVFKKEDVFVQELDEGSEINWLVPNSQKNAMEPMLVNLKANSSMRQLEPHFADIFLYVLLGEITLTLDKEQYKIKKEQSLYLSKPRKLQEISNQSKKEASFIWVSTPPIY